MHNFLTCRNIIIERTVTSLRLLLQNNFSFIFIIFDKYSLIQFIGLVVVIQVIHDILFYLFVSSVPRGVSKILDVFKDYGKENGLKAIISDSAMMISSVLIASYLKGQTLNTNIIVLIVSVYLVPYFIYSI